MYILSRKKIVLFILVCATAAFLVFFSAKSRIFVSSGPAVQSREIVREISKSVPEGATFDVLAKEAGVNGDGIAAILAAAKRVYDLNTIVSGRVLAFARDEGGETSRVVYHIDDTSRLVVEKEEGGAWEGRRESIPYTVVYETASSLIESSLYETIVSSGLDERLAIALSEIFAWQIDFAADVQKGDGFRVYYEKRYLDGAYAMPGRILAAEFINNGKTYRGFFFRGSESREGYYDEDGNALQKVFLKSPLQYKYISSGYTTRIRRVSSLGLSGPHRGIDYAASYGTPAVSVGDGIVLRAGWNKYLGWSAEVRHNDTYKTVYGHFQSFARGIKRGVRVTQGQVVGYVGSSGYSTGPHLHFEMHKNGAYVNPFTIDVPPGEPITSSDQELFYRVIGRIRQLAGF